MRLIEVLLSILIVVTLSSHSLSRSLFQSPVTDVKDRFGNVYRITETYARDSAYYVESLSYKNGLFLETAGEYGTSKIHFFKLDNSSKKTVLVKSTNIESQFFAEGSDIFTHPNGEQFVYMLVYERRRIHKFDLNLQLITNNIMMPRELREGWGMTHDPKNPHIAIISDGSHKLFYCDVSRDFEIVRIVEVMSENGYRQDSLNELEFIKGYIWASIFLTDYIVKIDPSTGNIIHRFDFSYISNLARRNSNTILGRSLNYDDVLNGIAYNEEINEFYITGKKYPHIYQIKILTQEAA